MEKNNLLKRLIIGAIVIILILTILEFPAPIGFETRLQDNVSIYWLILFLLILITEIATIPLIFLKPKIGSIIGILAGVLNILQIIANQMHLMQPEVASLGYTLLEYLVGLVSLILIYFSYKLANSVTKPLIH